MVLSSVRPAQSHGRATPATVERKGLIVSQAAAPTAVKDACVKGPPDRPGWREKTATPGGGQGVVVVALAVLWHVSLQ